MKTFELKKPSDFKEAKKQTIFHLFSVFFFGNQAHVAMLKQFWAPSRFLSYIFDTKLGLSPPLGIPTLRFPYNDYFNTAA